MVREGIDLVDGNPRFNEEARHDAGDFATESHNDGLDPFEVVAMDFNACGNRFRCQGCRCRQLGYHVVADGVCGLVGPVVGAFRCDWVVVAALLSEHVLLRRYRVVQGSDGDARKGCSDSRHDYRRGEGA